MRIDYRSVLLNLFTPSIIVKICAIDFTLLKHM